MGPQRPQNSCWQPSWKQWQHASRLTGSGMWSTTFRGTRRAGCWWKASRHAICLSPRANQKSYFITETYVEFTQESSGEQRYPDDFDCDDITIGQTLLDACRRRADHSREEGLSSCLSSSVSHDRTGRPVVCSPFVSQMPSVECSKFVQETQTSEKIRATAQKVSK